MARVLTAILLLLVALVLGAVLLLPGFIYALGTMAITGASKEMWYIYFYRIGMAVDELGNVVCSHLFNDTLIHKSTGYHFGLDGETVSSVLGKNVQRGTLRVSGRLLNFLLNLIQKSHAVLSINNNLNNNN